MKLTRHSVLTASSLIIGGIIGASALVALADNTWVSAPALTNPVTCDSSINGCNPPINVSGVAQTKTGLLSLGNFQFDPGGLAVTPGSTLTATGTNGTVQWTVPGLPPIKSFGTVSWVLMTNQAWNGQTYFACVSGTENGSAYCTGSGTDSVSVPSIVNGSIVSTTYKAIFGCNNGYQLASYFTSTSGIFSNQRITYTGYCTVPLNVIN